MKKSVVVSIEVDQELYLFMKDIEYQHAWLEYICDFDTSIRALSVAILMNIELDCEKWSRVISIIKDNSYEGDLDYMVYRVFVTNPLVTKEEIK